MEELQVIKQEYPKNNQILKLKQRMYKKIKLIQVVILFTIHLK